MTSSFKIISQVSNYEEMCMQAVEHINVPADCKLAMINGKTITEFEQFGGNIRIYNVLAPLLLTVKRNIIINMIKYN